MIRVLASAVLASAALLAATGASAQTFVAIPAAAPVKARVMTRDTPWQLRDGAYVTANAPVRATVLCQLVAREVGALSSFTADGRAFDAAKLDACNAKAGVAKVTIAKAAADATTAN